MSDELIFVVDDDDGVRRALARLLNSAGYRSETFASALEFMARPPSDDAPSCLVLDLQMPDMTGLELQNQLRASGHLVPIVFITGHGDIPTSVQAMRKGAVDFLSKPVTDEQLLSAIEAALERDRAALATRRHVRSLVARWQTLTPREREVFALVVEGLLNKQVAGRLGTAEKTIKAHRAKVVEKMAAGSLAELVRMADTLRGTLPGGSI